MLAAYTAGMAVDGVHLLDHLQTPAMVVSNGQVTFANAAAKALLGRHIVGEDVRIAIRDPDAIEVILSDSGGATQVIGLSVGSSVWEIDSFVLGNGDRLVCLYDQSVQGSVARAHADFVANASHELRTPIATILGYAETLGNPKAWGDKATRERFLNTIAHEARRMQTLVSDLMSLSRIEANKHEVPGEVVDIVAIARETAGEFGADGAVEVTTNCETAEILGDRGQLAQVLRNLIENSRKYGRDGAPVQVSVELTPTGWVFVAVKDEGEGISPEHLPRLTERFYRADTSRSRAAGGTGLGLSIVKHVVERHRGRFDITSRQGVGTTASMILPPRPA